MVKWQGRPSSDNMRSEGDIRSRFDPEVPKIPRRSNIGLPGLDIDRVIGEVALKSTNRASANPELYDWRIDEYTLQNGALVGMPTAFLLDSFKRAREVGLPVNWTQFKK